MHNLPRTRCRIARGRLEVQLWLKWRLVRVINAREAGQLTAPSFGIQALRVAGFTYRERRIYENLKELR